MKKNIRSYLAIGLLIVGALDLNPSKIIDLIPIGPPALVVEIDKELQSENIKKTKPLADLVTNKDDRISIAVFYDEFSLRVSGEKYTDIKLQTLNDIINEAGTIFFVPSIAGKYDGLGDGIVSLITEAVGDDDIHLSEENRMNLSGLFKAFAWNLSQ